MPEKDLETAVFGGGCFWCTEAIFKSLKGVVSVEPGYAGGDKENPIYEEVSSGKTGHAEVVKVIFDPGLISYQDLLKVFFATHDPTTPNRQGNDIGSQYRSIILYDSGEQKRIAEEFIMWLSDENIYIHPIVTEVMRLYDFYPAEEYHHDYFKKNPGQAYCQIVINPKLEVLKEDFPELIK